LGEQGKLPAYRINEQYRFNRAELLEWATSQRLNVSADIFAEPAGDGPAANLTESLKAGGIHYRLDGIDKLSVLQSLVEIMPLPERVDRQFLSRCFWRVSRSARRHWGTASRCRTSATRS